MNDIAIQHADEHITITLFGRLALLHGRVEDALDDETADRQYALEAVSTELARILDEASAGPAAMAGGGALAADQHQPLARAHYTAPSANAVVEVAGWPGQGSGQGPKGDSVACDPVVTKVTVHFFGDESEDAGGVASEDLATTLITAARAFGGLLLRAADLAEWVRAQ